MTKITKEELLKIAQASAVQLYDDEIDPLVKRLDAILTYAVRVKDIAGGVDLLLDKACNIMREDVVQQSNVEPIMAQAPEREENYFVVPMIIEK